MTNALRALGITVVPSSANFVLLVFAERNRTPPLRRRRTCWRVASSRARRRLARQLAAHHAGLESDNDAVLRADASSAAAGMAPSSPQCCDTSFLEEVHGLYIDGRIQLPLRHPI